MSPTDTNDPELTQLRRTNRMLQQREKTAERIRKQWSTAVTQLQESHDREKVISQQLAEKESFLSSITASMNEGVYVLDTEGKLTFMNPKAETLLGWSYKELLGKNMHDTIHACRPDGTRMPAEECPIQKSIHNGKHYSVEKDWFQAKDGSFFPVAFFSSPLIGSDQNQGSVAVFRNISQEIEIEKRLIESEKMASLGGMVAGVAHEINTPVGVGVTAITYLEGETKQFENAFQQGGLTKENLSHYLSTVTESSNIVISNLKRAALLIQNFKKVAVNQSRSHNEEFLLQPFIDELLHSLQPRFRQHPITIEVDCSPNLTMHSDAGALSQVLINLIENSLIHAYPEQDSGLIHIQATLSEETTKESTIKTPMITLNYQDDGVGMSESVRQHIFEPFFTTRRNSGGSGLGMQIVYNLVVHRLQGTIQVWSQPEQGSHFLITLPAAIHEPIDG